MIRRLAYRGICAGVVLCLLCVATLPALAQEGQGGKPSEAGATKAKPQSVPKGGPAPRATDGHVDLSGSPRRLPLGELGFAKAGIAFSQVPGPFQKEAFLE